MPSRPEPELQGAEHESQSHSGGGAGNVGATVARCIADKELADVVLVDIADRRPQGMALDISRRARSRVGRRVIGGSRLRRQTANSDVVVITSGVPRKPGMSRDDLLNVNFNIMKAVTEQVVKYSPNAIIVPVANPLDAMCQAVYRLSGFPRERVIGMAGVLDSARMRTFIAMELNVSVENVHAFVLGGHGDTMVPLPRYSTVAGIPITELLSTEQIEAICDAHRQRRRRDHQAGRHQRLVRAGRRRRPRWSSASSRTRRRSCRARCSCRASTASTTCSSACR